MVDLELTRRDALLALGSVGLSASAWALREQRETEESVVTTDDIEALVALAETLYPSEVTVSFEFVETYVVGQRELDENYPAAITDALTTVRRKSQRKTGTELPRLSREERGSVLRSTGAGRAYPDPDGTDAERVRYYVINNLLYALYTTPKGGETVGNPNPPGYPGGTTSYQKVTTDE